MGESGPVLALADGCMLVGTNTLDTHTSPTQCMHAQESGQNTVQPVWKSRPYASPRIQIRKTRVLPRSLESSPAAHASNPRSDHHWLHLYRGVRYYDLNYSSPPFYNGRRFCPSPSSAPIVLSSNFNGGQSNLLGRNLVPFSCFVYLPSNLRGTTCDQDIIYHSPIPPAHSLHHFKTLRLSDSCLKSRTMAPQLRPACMY